VKAVVDDGNYGLCGYFELMERVSRSASLVPAPHDCDNIISSAKARAHGQR
jgi:hypothetical protein